MCDRSGWISRRKCVPVSYTHLTRTLPPAVSRTLRGLEEKGYVERSADKKDRRNTYISLTEQGWKKGEEVRDRMHAVSYTHLGSDTSSLTSVFSSGSRKYMEPLS